jgi:hypothetical protein
MMSEPANRDESGRFPKGVSGNPKGRSKELPADFRAKGPEALQRMLGYMEHEDPAIAQKATTWVAERIYGKAPTAPEDQEAQAQNTATFLSLLVTSYHQAKHDPKPAALEPSDTEER